MAARNAYFPLFIILNRWKIRGRPFDSEGGGGGGWQILSGQIIYFHHGLGITGWGGGHGLFIFMIINRYT